MTTKEIRAKLKKLPASEQARLIDEWITGRLARRNRKIIKSYLIDGEGSIEKIAEKYELSYEQTKRIIKRSCDALSRHL